MPRYFNKTPGLVNVTLKDGSAAVVPSKQYLEVSADQDGSSSLRTRVAKGLLIRMEDPPKPDVDPGPEEAPVSESPEEEVDEAEESVEEAAEEAEDGPTMRWRKGDLVEYAEKRGIDVEGMDKSEILAALQEDE